MPFGSIAHLSERGYLGYELWYSKPVRPSHRSGPPMRLDVADGASSGFALVRALIGNAVAASVAEMTTSSAARFKAARFMSV